MLTGKELGAAIEAARVLKKVTKKAMAEHFDVSPPAIQDWVNRGTIDKSRLPGLWEYFKEVVGPQHWGLKSFNVGAAAYAADDASTHAILHAMEPPPGIKLSAKAFNLAARLDALPEAQRLIAYSMLANMLDLLEAQAAPPTAPHPPTKSSPRAKRSPSRQHAR